MADPLRLRATVADGFTTPLRKLREELKSVAAASPTKELRKQWEGVRGELSQTAAVLRTGLAPQFGFLQMGALGLGTAIGGAGLALTNFAKGTRDLSLFTREFGLNIDKFRAWSQVLGEVGVSQETLKGSLQGFASVAKDIRNKWGQVYADLQAMNLGDLAESIANSKNFEQAIERAFAGLQKIPDPVRRRRVAQMLFGVDDIGSAIGAIEGDITTKTRQMMARLGKIGPEGEAAARKFVEGMNEIAVSMERLKVNALGPLLGELNELFKRLETPIGGELKASLDTIARALRQLRDVTDALNKGQRTEALKMLMDDRVRPEDLEKQRMDGRFYRGMRGRLGIGADGQITKKEDELATAQGRLESLQRLPGQDLPARVRARTALEEEIRRLTDEIKRLREQGATVQQQSFGGDGIGGGLIHKAALGSGVGGMRAGIPRFGGLGGLPGLGGGSGAPGGTGGRTRAPGGLPDLGGRAPGIGAGAPAGARLPRLGGVGSGAASRSFFDALKADGWSDEQAAALVGHAQKESSLNPRAFNQGEGAFGLLQWREKRQENLRAYAKERGLDPGSMEAQAGFIRHEMETDPYERKMSRGFRSAKTLEEASAGLERYIRFGDGSGAQRLRHAQDALAAAKSPKQAAEGKGLIFHHSGGRGTPDDVIRVLKQRGLGAQYIMDRDGNVVETGLPSRHMRPAENGSGLTNRNTYGIEVIARDDKDVTPGQIEAARRWAQKMVEEKGVNPDLIYGHGEVNAHKQRTEGSSIVNSLREDRSWLKQPEPVAADRPGDAMMQRAMSAGVLGGGGQKVDAKGSVSISFENMPGNFKARTSTEGLFKEVDVRNTRSASAPVMHEEDI